MLAGLVAACGGGGGGEASDSTEADELSPVPDPLETLAEPTPGQGVAVIGIEELSFTVTACTEGPRPEDTPEATLDYMVEGEGDTSDGPFLVQLIPLPVRHRRGRAGADRDGRASSSGPTPTPGASRPSAPPPVSTAPGSTSPTPAANTALIERRGDSYDVRGTFGPEGARIGDEGLEDGRLRARCPA